MSTRYTSYSSAPTGPTSIETTSIEGKTRSSQYSCGVRADFIFDEPNNNSNISGKYVIGNGLTKFKLSTYEPFNKSFINKIINTHSKFISSASVPLYVMGIMYNDNNGPKTDGVQLTVTGKAKLGESIKEAMNRELHEEAGFVISNFTNVYICSSKYNRKKKSTAVVRVTDCKIPISPIVNSGIDNCDQRVEIAVIGTAAEFKNILGLVVKRPRIELAISGVMFTRIDHFITANK